MSQRMLKAKFMQYIMLKLNTIATLIPTAFNKKKKISKQYNPEQLEVIYE